MTPHAHILIVLYNKKIEESESVDSLLNSEVSSVDLHIHNNGPCKVELSEDLVLLFKSKNIKVSLCNCIDNKPLSLLYNDFICSISDYNKIVILDDDTTITTSFALQIMNGNCDVTLPRIISRGDNKEYYPLKNGDLLINYGVLDTINNIWSIGSGIIVSKKTVDVFAEHKIKLFDEHYALYGVDISFFRNLWILEKRGVKFRVCVDSILVHSLSRVETVQSEFRVRERLIDIAITARRYPSTRKLLSFCKQIIKHIVEGHFKISIIAISCFLSGIHPRISAWKVRQERSIS